MITDIPWMMAYDFIAQHASVDMGINLCSGDGFMSQHGLDSSQVSPSLQQMGGKRVAEGVWTDGFLDASLLCQFFDKVKHHDA